MFERWWIRRKDPGPAEEAGGTFAATQRARPDTSRCEPTPEDEELLDRIAAAVTRRGMDAPAIFLLESAKPLSFLGGQFLHFLSPIVHSVADLRDLDRVAVLLERRETVEELIVRIERAGNGDAPASASGDSPGRT